MNTDFIATSHAYMLTSAILLVALTMARGILVQLLIPVLGLAACVVWILQICLWRELEPTQRVPTLVLASIFVAGWIVPLLGIGGWHVWQ